MPGHTSWRGSDLSTPSSSAHASPGMCRSNSSSAAVTNGSGASSSAASRRASKLQLVASSSRSSALYVTAAKQGLAYIARHVIQRTLSNSLMIQMAPSGLANVAIRARRVKRWRLRWGLRRRRGR